MDMQNVEMMALAKGFLISDFSSHPVIMEIDAELAEIEVVRQLLFTDEMMKPGKGFLAFGMQPKLPCVPPSNDNEMNWVLANPTKSINNIGVTGLEFNVLFHLFAAESVLFGGKRNRGHSRVSHHKLSHRNRFFLLLFFLKENNALFALESRFHYAKSSVAEDIDYNARIFLSAMFKA